VNFVPNLAGIACFKEKYRRVENRIDGFDASPSDFRLLYTQALCTLVQLYLSPDAQHYCVTAILATQMAAGALRFFLVPALRTYKQEDAILTFRMNDAKSLSQKAPLKSRIVELRRLVVIKVNGTYRCLQKALESFKFHLFTEEGTVRSH
jgi:hypothetical protein